MSNVKSYKMVNGMEIFGKVTAEDVATISLDDAVAAILSQKGDGGLALEFRPLSLLVDKGGPAKVTLNRSAVAFEYEAGEEYRNAFVTSVSGIIIAKG